MALFLGGLNLVCIIMILSRQVRQHSTLFSPLGKHARRAIYFADVFFIIYFLMIDFLDPVAHN